MTFLYAVLLVMAVPIARFFGLMGERAQRESAGESPDFDWQKQWIWRAGTVIVAPLPFMLALMVGIADANAREYKMGAMNWSPILFVVAAFIGFGCYGPIAIKLLRERETSVTKQLWQGAWLIASLACLYIGYAAVDHLLFWKDKDKVGIASSMLFEKADVKCDSGAILVKREGEGFIYRCPHNVALGNPLGEPFVPWPSYREGYSTQLLIEFKKLEAEAKKSAESGQ